MSYVIKEYSKNIYSFFLQNGKYRLAQLSVNERKEEINMFKKFISKNESLLSNFPSIENEICNIINVHNFDNLFEYQYIENAIPDLKLLFSELNVLLEKKQQFTEINKRFENDNFIEKIKNIQKLCKEKTTLQNIKTRINEIQDFISQAKNYIIEIETISKKITTLNIKLQEIDLYYNRYNKDQETAKAKQIIENYNNNVSLSGISHQINEVDNQIQILESVKNNFDTEKERLIKTQNSLSSNIKLWKEDADELKSDIANFLPNLFISKFDINELLNQITQKENLKKQEITNYKNSIPEILDKYSTRIKNFENNQKTKKKFEELKKEIINENLEKEKSRKQKNIIKKVIIIASLVTILIIIISMFFSGNSLDYEEFTDSRDGKKYKTIKIGEQIWMAENLAYKADTGCWAYKYDPDNVEKYGYYYNYETACKVCPDGWHLPTKEEFEILLNNYGGNSDAQDAMNANYKALKPGGISGFSFRKVGVRYENGNFQEIDNSHNTTVFWSSSIRVNNCFKWGLKASGLSNSVNENNGYAIRCIKNDSAYYNVEKKNWNKAKDKNMLSSYYNYIENYPNGKYVEDAKKNIEEQIIIEKKIAENRPSNTFYDSRNGKTYEIIKIGNQTWMAENLAYKVNSGCWAYNNYQSNVAKYRYLYNWETAKKVCPNGWHLPSDAEWTILTNYLGGLKIAGEKLKSTSNLWNSPNEGATNSSGFSALPGGYRYNNGAFGSVGNSGCWWSATEYSSTNAFARSLHYNKAEASRYNVNKSTSFSVRCIMD